MPHEGGSREALLPLCGMLELLGVADSASERFIESLPFSVSDATVGVENELQAVVIGDRTNVDLPITIEHSNFYANILRRTKSGDTSKRTLTSLERYLSENSENVWENSFVRFPRCVLSPFADRVLEEDLLSDRRNPEGGQRTDAGKFVFRMDGEAYVRIPVSHLLKLSLADAISAGEAAPELVRSVGQRLMAHFLNDNTSPETFSFHPVPFLQATDPGRAVGRETAKRYLLTQLLTFYANEKFWLRPGGQRVVVYFSPLPPIHQQRLNHSISDTFYRELFMNPCLSGWDRGEEKHRYMGLCHQILSRSQMNALGKLREAGIITRNLVVLPNPSNLSLSNNGAHLSLGSRRLTRALRDAGSGFNRVQEKVLGDLVIKIVEHFLPLFVGTYSAAPFRLDFRDFHPERVLGFLPHELDYTHLRMIWRRWKGKAGLKILGPPFGPDWLDRTVASLFRLKGDFVPDFRLIDYFVSLMSTDRCPSLDGRLGNDERLKRDLMELGVFDPQMSFYLLYRLRAFDRQGFSGFEGRHYSLFEGLEQDLGRAAELQTLVTALAFKYIARARYDHRHIPDDPVVESERRQILFGAAIGIPTFYVRENTGNALLRRVVEGSARVRQSRRYPGYLRVYNAEYRRALIGLLREDGADLIEALGLEETLRDLEARLADPGACSTTGRLTRRILEDRGVASPLRLDAETFNGAAERYYRGPLRVRHLREAFALLEEDCLMMDAGADETCREALQSLLNGSGSAAFVAGVREDAIRERASIPDLRRLVHLLLITIHRDILQAEGIGEERCAPDAAPVH